MLLLSINREPIAPSHLILSDLERSKVSSDFEALYPVKEPS